jgi:hypothetical protein
MAQPFFAASNRLATVFGGAVHAQREFEMTVPLNAQVSFQDILHMLDCVNPTAIWLDGECVVVDARRCDESVPHLRYEIVVYLMLDGFREFDLFQAPGTRERGAPLPALEYFLTRLASDGGVHSLWIVHSYHPNLAERTLDVSPACFSIILQTRRSLKSPLELLGLSLTAEQTAVLFAHDAGPIFMHLDKCRFHGPTLLQLGSVAHLMGGGGSDLDITLGENDIGSIAIGELTALVSNPHLRTFRSYFHAGVVSYETVKKLVSALAANKISRLECLDLDIYRQKIEWEKEDEPSVWIDLWMAIGQHSSLKEI